MKGFVTRRPVGSVLQAFLFYAVALALAVALTPKATTFAYAFTPLVAVLIMLFFVACDGYTREGLKSLGLHRPGFDAWPAALLVPLFVMGFAYGFVWTTGIADFAAPEKIGGHEVPPWLPSLPTVFLIVKSGLTTTLAEEVGWRGYLLPRLERLGPWKAVLLSGFLHGVWHLPLIFLTTLYHADGSKLVAIPLFLLSLTIAGMFFGYLRLKTNGVWPAVIAHSTHNVLWAVFGWVVHGRLLAACERVPRGRLRDTCSHRLPALGRRTDVHPDPTFPQESTHSAGRGRRERLKKETSKEKVLNETQEFPGVSTEGSPNTKRILDCAGKSSRGWTVLGSPRFDKEVRGRALMCEVLCPVAALVDGVSNAEVAAAFGADLILLNMFEGGDIKEITARLGRPVGVNVEPRPKVPPHRRADRKNIERLKEANFPVVTANPDALVSVEALAEAMLTVREVATSAAALADKMHRSGARSLVGAEEGSRLAALADGVLVPAPGTVPGSLEGRVAELVDAAHEANALANALVAAIGTSQEGLDAATVRQLALAAKRCGADAPHLGDAGVSSLAEPENILAASLAIRGKRHTYRRMAMR